MTLYVCYQMPTSWVKTNLFLTFEIATKWQNGITHDDPKG